jgi:hypothetical protein
MDPSIMTPRQLWQAGLGALAEKLGPAGLVRFLELWEQGSGDYTRERHGWLDGLTVDDLAAEAARDDRPAS